MQVEFICSTQGCQGNLPELSWVTKHSYTEDHWQLNSFTASESV